MFKDRSSFVLSAGLPGLVLAALLTACGGGGGGSSTTPSAPAPASPTAIPPAAITAVAKVNDVSVPNAKIVFSCGCTGQAGIALADASGNYTIGPSATATPAAPTPTYTTVPGRNYLSVITTPNGAQAWDIAFLGSTPGHNHTLNPTNTSDVYTTAAALYVFYNSTTTNPTAFDSWNFTTILAWVISMQSAPLPPESTLLADIVSAQNKNVSLYPSTGAAWVPAGTTPNLTIKTDLDNVKGSATAAGQSARLPQQCAPADQPCAVPTP